jgi:hypothetical protein
MMIDIAEEEYKLTYEKLPRTIDHFKQKNNNSVRPVICSGDRQVYYRRLEENQQGSKAN